MLALLISLPLSVIWVGAIQEVTSPAPPPPCEWLHVLPGEFLSWLADICFLQARGKWSLWTRFQLQGFHDTSMECWPWPTVPMVLADLALCPILTTVAKSEPSSKLTTPLCVRAAKCRQLRVWSWDDFQSDLMFHTVKAIGDGRWPWGEGATNPPFLPTQQKYRNLKPFMSVVWFYYYLNSWFC